LYSSGATARTPSYRADVDRKMSYPSKPVSLVVS
jgi:hypothetical protein